MMPTQGQGQQPPANINQFQDTMMNVVYNVCSIVTLPVEMALRPQYGSRYFPPVILFFSAVMMMVLPVLSEMASGFSRMLPFGGFQMESGMFGMEALSKVYFLGSFIHGFRIWRRMLHMELEENSVYEGPPLPIFRIIPGSFWMVRIIYEPVFVFTLSLVLPNFFILQPSAAHYLSLAAIMLALKNYVQWYRTWEFLRNMMDLRFAGPRIAKLVENQATEDDLAPIHLASFPKNLPDDVRQAAASHIARVFSAGAETPAPEPKPETTASEKVNP
jgi:hypothetical protein